MVTPIHPRRPVPGAQAVAESWRMAYRVQWDHELARWPLAVRSAGHAVFSDRFSERPRQRSFLMVLWSLEGQGCFVRDGGTNPIRSGEWLWVPPGTRYALIGASRRWETRWLTIDGPSVASWTAGWEPPVGPCCPCASLDTTRHDHIIVGLGESTLGRQLACLEHATALLAAGLHANKRCDLVDRALTVIEAEHRDPRFDTAVLAQMLHCHRSHLGRLFAAHKGSGPGTLLRQRRVSSAQALLLQDSDAPLEEVAAEAGFAGRGQLTRAFLQICGMPPRAWRRAEGLV